MTRIHLAFTQALIATLAVASVAWADEQKPAATQSAASPDHIVVAFSDPTQPGKLSVKILSANISIKGYGGKDVVIDARMGDDDEKEGKNERQTGMHRIRSTAAGLEVEEEHNVMSIRTGFPNNRPVHLSIQVPTRTALDLSVVNDSDITVDSVDGDIVANNTNGAITLNNVSGAVVAHALNEDVKATFTRYSGKPMSFSSLNGTIDVTLPADTKANVKLQSDNGDVYSDFPVEMMTPSVNQTVQDDRSKGGKYRLKIEKAMTGRINGGGPEITFKTFNGDIRLRRAGGASAGSAR
jgi:Putative adhesin